VPGLVDPPDCDFRQFAAGLRGRRQILRVVDRLLGLVQPEYPDRVTVRIARIIDVRRRRDARRELMFTPLLTL
jgi:hypothetical protein